MPASNISEPHAGRVALVTGTSRGIGQAIAVGLAERGARVVLGDRGDASKTIALIADTGHQAVPVALDVSDRSSIEAASRRVAEELGHVDILVNNAGTFESSTWDDLDFDLWQRVMNVDLNGPMLMCKAFLPLMRGRGWGRVINIASATVAIASPVSIAYRTSKMAVIGFTRALSATLGDEGITISVCTRARRTVRGRPAGSARGSAMVRDAGRPWPSSPPRATSPGGWEGVVGRLEGKVALITGGYGGMGRASARLFTQEGATVFVAGRNRERGDAFVQELTDAGGKAYFTELDVVNQDQWDAAVAQAKERAGGLHVLMNIVGSNALVRFPEVDIAEFNKIFEINVTGTLRGIQTCAPLIKDSGGGSIVNIGSVAGITGNFGTGYSSSKWALEGLSRSAAYVYADWGIRCNVIQPGWIETDLTASMRSNPLMKRMQKTAMNHTVLLRRGGKAEEIGYTALFLASDESSYITGTDIVVDGGWFSSAPYLANEWSHHMLSILDKKEHLEEMIHRFH